MRYLLWFSVFYALSLAQGQESSIDDPESPYYINMTGRTEIEVLMAKWSKLEDGLRSGVDQITKTAMPYLLRAVSEAEVESECQSGLIALLSGIRDLKGWAFRMLDAIGKPTSGIFAGTVTFLGAYDECLAVEYRRNNRLQFKGQYCTLELRPPLPTKPDFYTMHHVVKEFQNFSEPNSAISDFHKLIHVFYLLSFRLGLCVPSVCSRNDMEKIVQLVAERIYFTASISSCEVEKEVTLTIVQLVTMSCFAILFALVLLGTLVDVLHEKWTESSNLKQKTIKTEGGLAVRIIICWSAKQNFRYLFSTKSSNSTSIDSDHFLHAMRAISSAWLVAGSVFLSLNYQILSQMRNAINLSKKAYLQPIFSSPLAIDTFLFTTAYFLGATVSRRKYKKLEFFDYIFLLLNKVSRLLPALIFCTGIALLMPLAANGPLANEVTGPIYENCANNWWSNFLFVGNLAQPANERCLYNSWYISSEMQLFVFGLILIFIWSCNKHPSIACFMFIVIMTSAASIAVIGAISASYNFPPTLLFSQIDLRARSFFEDLSQHKPYAHLPTWCVGMVIGLFFSNGSKFQLRRMSTIFGWCIFFVCSSAVVFGVYEWNKNEILNSNLAPIYAAAHRPVWALCLAWIAFSCISGSAATLNELLSWPGWIPISRLSYIQYLSFPLFQDLLAAYTRDSLQTSMYMSVYLFSGIFLMSFGIATMGALLVQIPIIQIKKLIFKTGSQSSNCCVKTNPSSLSLPVVLDRTVSTTSTISITSEHVQQTPTVWNGKKDSWKTRPTEMPCQMECEESKLA